LGVTVIPKSFTDAVPDVVFWKFVPATVNVPLLPMSGGFVGGFVGEGGVTVTVTVTVTAAVIVGELPVVIAEVGTVPRLHRAVGPVPLQPLPARLVILEFAGSPMLSVNTTPATGSPVL
jgi:hypothetical protein